MIILRGPRRFLLGVLLLGWISTSQSFAESSLKTLNFRISPLGFMSDAYGVAVDVGILSGLTLAPSFNYYTGTTGSNQSDFYEIGLQSSISLTGKRYQEGLLLRAGVYWVHVNVVNSKSGATANASSKSGTVFLAYCWPLLDWGLSTSIGTGITYLDAPTAKSFQPRLEISLGFAL